MANPSPDRASIKTLPDLIQIRPKVETVEVVAPRRSKAGFSSRPRAKAPIDWANLHVLQFPLHHVHLQGSHHKFQFFGRVEQQLTVIGKWRRYHPPARQPA